jgi:hypothetical protein
MNEATGELIGHLADISTTGFKLDCQKSLPLEKEYLMRVDLTGDVARKNFMVFKARSKWCRADRYDASEFNVGFQIIEMAPSDMEIFVRMFEKYGAQSGKGKDDLDYLWK